MQARGRLPVMTTKTYLSAQPLLEDSFRLGVQVINSGFRPTVMIAIWRGGTPMGIAVQALLAYRGIETDHTCDKNAILYQRPKDLTLYAFHGEFEVIQ